MTARHADDNATFYLIGGGIASLAAAASLIRDGSIKGSKIKIMEESELMGGSLDAGGDSKHGYTMRGGRMLESKYLCTFDLFSSISTLDGSQTVTEEIFAWNRTMKTSSKSRLVRHGKAIDTPSFGLSEAHVLTIERLSVPETLPRRPARRDSQALEEFGFHWSILRDARRRGFHRRVLGEVCSDRGLRATRSRSETACRVQGNAQPQDRS